MRRKVEWIEQLTDSRFYMEKDIPSFGYYIVLIATALCFLSVIWATYTHKLYVVRATGVVTNEEYNTVMCGYTGRVEGCLLTENMLVEKGDVLFRIRSTDYDLQREQLEIVRAAYQTEIEKNTLLVKSVEDDVNYFEESVAEDLYYYSLFEEYKSKLKQAEADVSIYSSYGYTDEQIEVELKKNEGEIAGIYYNMIQTIENSILEKRQQINAIDAQLASITHGREEYEIEATASGVVHLVSPIKNGMMVQTMDAVAIITPVNSRMVIESFVSTQDMARIHVGDSVQIVIDGLSQNAYGSINGRVEEIDSNISNYNVNSENQMPMFRVIISMEKDYLISHEGDKVDVLNGMTAVGRIVYDKVTYFDYFLGKIGIKNWK